MLVQQPFPSKSLTHRCRLFFYKTLVQSETYCLIYLTKGKSSLFEYLFLEKEEVSKLAWMIGACSVFHLAYVRWELRRLWSRLICVCERKSWQREFLLSQTKTAPNELHTHIQMLVWKVRRTETPQIAFISVLFFGGGGGCFLLEDIHKALTPDKDFQDVSWTWWWDGEMHLTLTVAREVTCQGLEWETIENSKCTAMRKPREKKQKLRPKVATPNTANWWIFSDSWFQQERGLSFLLRLRF